MDSLTRWTWVTPRFQPAVSDSINLRLIVGCLLTISKVILTYFAPEILNRTHILLISTTRPVHSRSLAPLCGMGSLCRKDCSPGFFLTHFTLASKLFSLSVRGRERF